MCHRRSRIFIYQNAEFTFVPQIYTPRAKAKGSTQWWAYLQLSRAMKSPETPNVPAHLKSPTRALSPKTSLPMSYAKHDLCMCIHHLHVCECTHRKAYSMDGARVKVGNQTLKSKFGPKWLCMHITMRKAIPANQLTYPLFSTRARKPEEVCRAGNRK